MRPKERRTLMKTISRLFSVLVGVIGMTVMVSHTALAQDDVPGSCQVDARSTAQYRTGLQFGRLVVDQAWNTINQDCSLLETFTSILENSFNSLILPPNASRAVQCRHAGIVNAGIDALDDLWPVCTGLCTTDGLDIGKLVGKLYCDLSIALGGLAPAEDFIRGPVMWCQFLGQTFCDVSYISFTPVYESPIGSCRPYTYEPYFETWDQFRNNGCAENAILPVQETEDDK
jgi:hypothetical protein